MTQMWALWKERASQLESEMYRAMRALSTSTRPRWRDSDGGVCLNDTTMYAENWHAQLVRSLYARLLEPSDRTLKVWSSTLATANAAAMATPGHEDESVSLLALPNDILGLILWRKLQPSASLACAATCKLLEGLLEDLLESPLRISVLSAPSSTHFVWPLQWHTWQSHYTVLSAELQGAWFAGDCDLTDASQLKKLLETWFEADGWGYPHAPGIFATTLRRYWDACEVLTTQVCARRRQQLNHLVSEFARLGEQLDSIDEQSGDAVNYDRDGFMNPALWLSMLVYIAPTLSEHGPLTSGPVIVSIGRVITNEAEAYTGDHKGFGHPEVILVMRLESGRVLAVHFPRMRCGMYGCCDDVIASTSPRPVQSYSAASFEELCCHRGLSHVSVRWIIS